MYIDYYIIHKVVTHFLKTDSKLHNQVMFFGHLFASFLEKRPNGIDPSDICKMTKGMRKVNEKVQEYYATEEAVEQLAMDIEEKIFPELGSYKMMTQHILMLVNYDREMKETLEEKGYMKSFFQWRREAAEFVAYVVQYAIRREFFQRDNETGRLTLPEWMVPNLQKYILGPKVPAQCKYFRGRDREIEKLHEQLTQKRVVFLYGIPGIGKSELVYAYCKEMRAYYNNILYIDYSGDLREDICSLKMVGGVVAAEDGFENIMRFLRLLREDMLLVIDNMNATFAREKYLSEVLDCGCKVLVTTRCNFETEEGLELEEIQDQQVLIAVVKEISGIENLDQTTLTKVIEAVHCHTTAIILLAGLIRKQKYTAQEILIKLRLKNLRIFCAEKIRFRKGNKRIAQSYYEHLRLLFGLFDFAESEQNVIRNMVLMPKNGICTRLFGEWAELANTNVIYDLIETGLLHEIEPNVVKLKPIIREMAKEELEPAFGNCEKILRNTTNAMALLQDTPADKYLLLLPEEVIEWAKKDDVEAYIGFLHKSFELAAKYDKRATMAQIADALAEVIVGTPYGSNLDRALMQDYQASVADDVKRAIEFRESAIEQLDLYIPLEKQAAADILSRLSENYESLNQLNKAKEYSDMGWIMLEELGLAETKEAFNAACRRGVLLCSVGVPEEGLALLHRMEHFVMEQEKEISINHAVIFSAMCSAYEKVGDMVQSSAWLIKANHAMSVVARQVNAEKA